MVQLKAKMRRKNWAAAIGTMVLAAAAFTAPAQAEDVEKKWRIGFSLGGMNNSDAIESDAQNVFQVLDRDFEPVRFFIDPRSDQAVFGKLDINSAPAAMASVQYAINKVLIAEITAGYQKADVGDIEVQAQFDGQFIDTQIRPFDFQTYRIPAGELERVPIQFNLMARFRPRANFNPYFGAGLGYSIIGFEPSPELNTLSRNIDASLGAQTRLTGPLNGNPSLNSTVGGVQDLTGAEIEAGDTFEWNLFFGAEYSFKSKWALYLDFKRTLSSRQLSFRFNDSDSLGISVPNLTDFSDAPNANGIFGAMDISVGGLIDGGGLQPLATAPPGTDCAVQPGSCQWVLGAQDGNLDTGFYYVQGGELSYDAFSVQLGIRYTF